MEVTAGTNRTTAFLIPKWVGGIVDASVISCKISSVTEIVVSNKCRYRSSFLAC